MRKLQKQTKSKTKVYPNTINVHVGGIASLLLLNRHGPQQHSTNVNWGCCMAVCKVADSTSALLVLLSATWHSWLGTLCHYDLGRW
jgi:hypothetical protein